MAVIAIMADYIVVFAQGGDGAYAHGLFSDVEVKKASYATLHVQRAALLFEAANEVHLPVQVAGHRLVYFGRDFHVEHGGIAGSAKWDRALDVDRLSLGGESGLFQGLGDCGMGMDQPADLSGGALQ